MSDKPMSSEELAQHIASLLSGKYADERIAGAEVRGKLIKVSFFDLETQFITCGPPDLYQVHSKDHGICMVVGAVSYLQAARIVSEVIAEGTPPVTGGVCCVEKLCGPQQGGKGYYAAMAAQDRYYVIQHHKVKALPRGRRQW